MVLNIWDSNRTAFALGKWGQTEKIKWTKQRCLCEIVCTLLIKITTPQRIPLVGLNTINYKGVTFRIAAGLLRLPRRPGVFSCNAYNCCIQKKTKKGDSFQKCLLSWLKVIKLEWTHVVVDLKCFSTVLNDGQRFWGYDMLPFCMDATGVKT